MRITKNTHTRKCKIDLLVEMSRERKQNKIVVLLNQPNKEISSIVDYTIYLRSKIKKENILLGLNYTTFAQLLGIFSSLK
jgi:hypothetical protein